MAVTRILFLSLFSLSLSSDIGKVEHGNDIILASSNCWVCKKLLTEEAKVILDVSGYKIFIDHIKKQCESTCNYCIESVSYLACELTCFLVVKGIENIFEDEYSKIFFGDYCESAGYCSKHHGEGHMWHIEAKPKNVEAVSNTVIYANITVTKEILYPMIKTKVITPDLYEFDQFYQSQRNFTVGHWWFHNYINKLPQNSSIPLNDGTYHVELSACGGKDCFYLENPYVLFKGKTEFYLSKESYNLVVD